MKTADGLATSKLILLFKSRSKILLLLFLFFSLGNGMNITVFPRTGNKTNRIQSTVELSRYWRCGSFGGECAKIRSIATMFWSACNKHTIDLVRYELNEIDAINAMIGYN